MAADLPAVWSAPTTTRADRKELLRILIDNVTVAVEGDSQIVNVGITWAGGHQPDHASLDHARPEPGRYLTSQAGQKSTAGGTESISEETNLFLRIYIPSQRLYAEKSSKLLSLFREWLIAVRRYEVRESGYSTASGKVHEFFVQSVPGPPDLGEEQGGFSDFLTLCSKDRKSAADLLRKVGLDRASSSEIVEKFGREVRRLKIELRHEWERRTLAIRYELEEELMDGGVELLVSQIEQINTSLHKIMPNPSSSNAWPLISPPAIKDPRLSVTIINSPKIIHAWESAIIENVQGDVNLSPEAHELLALIVSIHGVPITEVS